MLCVTVAAMDAILSSFGLVALSEMGDKTQLLAFMLVARFRKPWTIFAGIFVATVLSNSLAAYFGSWISDQIPRSLLAFGLGLLFIGFGIWTLKADTDEEETEEKARFGAFFTAASLFFIGELGDKTQLATLTLAAQFQQVLPVIVGTTLGMLVSDGLAVFAGGQAIRRFSKQSVVLWMHRVAAAGFFAFGSYSFYQAWLEFRA